MASREKESRVQPIVEGAKEIEQGSRLGGEGEIAIAAVGEDALAEGAELALEALCLVRA